MAAKIEKNGGDYMMTQTRDYFCPFFMYFILL